MTKRIFSSKNALKLTYGNVEYHKFSGGGAPLKEERRDQAPSQILLARTATADIYVTEWLKSGHHASSDAPTGKKSKTKTVADSAMAVLYM